MPSSSAAHTLQDQAWIETLFGHVKGEWPHLEKITDPGELEAELELVRAEYNAVRLHAGIGYVTPADEHEGRGDAILAAPTQGQQLDDALRGLFSCPMGTLWEHSQR